MACAMAATDQFPCRDDYLHYCLSSGSSDEVLALISLQLFNENMFRHLHWHSHVNIV